MREAGIGLVAVNIFGWSSIEPRPGEYDFAGLDEIIELLHAAGIRVNLGTGTASPPPVADHAGTRRSCRSRPTARPGTPAAARPGAPARRSSGARARPGRAGRPALRRAPGRRALARLQRARLPQRALLRRRQRRGVPRLAHVAATAPSSALNEAWGTSFWSQRYADWDEIAPAPAALSLRNPAQLLDFHRFSSDELLDYYRAEAEVLRRTQHGAGHHELHGHRAHPQPRLLDLGAGRWTSSPTTTTSTTASATRPRSCPSPPTSPAASPAARPWMLMEQPRRRGQLAAAQPAKAPGEMPRNSLTHVARGCRRVCFFQWRASAQGAEKFHSALLPHAGTDTRRLARGAATSATLDRARRGRRHPGRSRRRAAVQLGVVVGRRRRGPPSAGRALPRPGARRLRALRELGVTADVVAPGADLEPLPRWSSCPLCTWSATTTPRAITRYVERRRTRGRHLLQRHRRRGRPGPPRRLPGRVPRPARRGRRGVPAAAAGRDGAARRRRDRQRSGPSGCAPTTAEAIDALRRRTAAGRTRGHPQRFGSGRGLVRRHRTRSRRPARQYRAALSAAGVVARDDGADRRGGAPQRRRPRSTCSSSTTAPTDDRRRHRPRPGDRRCRRPALLTVPAGAVRVVREEAAMTGAATRRPTGERSREPSCRHRRSSSCRSAALFTLFYLIPIGYAIVQSLLRRRAHRHLRPGRRRSSADSTQYQRGLPDGPFWESVLRVLLFGAVQVPVMLGLALLLALLLDSRPGRGKRFFRLAFFVPYAVPGVVAAIMWGFLYSPNLSPFTAVTGARRPALRRPRALVDGERRHLGLRRLQHADHLLGAAGDPDRDLRGGPARRRRPVPHRAGPSRSRWCARRSC